ncbi:MAG: VirB4 family type IV secretion system protein [Candidatus Acidiferrales bacterium]
MKPAFFRAARPSADLIPLSYFLEDDERMFATKSGGYGMCMCLAGIDPETRPREVLDSLSRRIAEALRNVPPEMSLFQYAIKQRGYRLPAVHEKREDVRTVLEDRAEYLNSQAGFGTVDLVWCLYVQPPNRNIQPAKRAAYISSLRRRLVRTADSFCRKLEELAPHLLTATETAAFFAHVLNLEPRLFTGLRSRRGLDRQLGRATVTWTDEYLQIGHRYAQMFSLIQRPSGTRPDLFGDLLRQDCDAILCSEWQPRPAEEVRRAVHNQESFIELFRHRIATYITHAGAKKEIAKSAGTIAADKSTDTLGGVLDELENGRRTYGRFSLIGMVHSEDLQEVREVLPVLHRIAGESKAAFLEETVGGLSAYYAMLPGNLTFNVRRAWLQDGHYANLAHVYAPFRGHEYSDALERESLVVYETRDRSPLFYDAYDGDLRGLLILGAPRIGKSVQGNFHLDQEAKYGGFSYIFDIGGSYESTARAHGGTVVRIGARSPRLNPFSLPPSEDNLMFLTHFVRKLLVNGGLKELNPADEDGLHKKIKAMYSFEPAARRLQNLVLPNHLRDYLRKWCAGGLYGTVFDNQEDELELSRIQVFDLQDIEGEHYADLREPLLFWLIKRVEQVVRDPKHLGLPKHLLFDECWKQLKDPYLVNFIVDTLKTGGKHLGGITLLTHTADDLAEHAGLIANACPTVLFLRDTTFDRARYRELFQLNEREIELLGSLEGKGEGLLKRRTWSKVVRLNLDRRALWRYTTKPSERRKRDALVEEHGFEKAFELLAAK